MKNRGFEIIKKYEGMGINLPQRHTRMSAGYDIEAAEDITLLPNCVTLVPTGLKAYMKDDEYLAIHVRSGFSIKSMVSCVNDEGVIDADYYDNKENEGHIFIALINHGNDEVFIKKGTRVAQGIFHKYLVTDDDDTSADKKRTGGMGSTGK